MDPWAVGRDIVMALITVLVFYWGKERKQTADAIEERIKGVERDFAADFELRDAKLDEFRRSIDQVHKTLEQANEKSSAMTGFVQAIVGRLDRMPEELRKTFMSLDRGMDLMNEARTDRKALWEIVDRLAQGPKRDTHSRND